MAEPIVLFEGLHTKLCNIVGQNRKVYFQPPENVFLSYPCIVYKLNGLPAKWADNVPYIQWDSYQIQYITRDPDDPVIRNICDSGLGFITLVNCSEYEGLHNYTYQLTTKIQRLDIMEV